ncbi:FAD:protein FMN transferase [uncultured Brachybacterium sp.]|uniref:FAD:protein FMN transferase n=1 Tax=uncultured Brachybacterium sp. TaxID=189680 RepID=UPI00262A05DE|nr:FAD:protein FMN transferase [uncultured Brachybacterium sp.]
MPDRPAAALRFDAIGTNWSITALTPLEHAREAILAAVEDFDRTYSRFRPDSLIRQFGDQGGTVRFPPDAVALFALIDQLHDATGGAFDPTVAAALEHLGYNEHYTLTPSPGDPPQAVGWSSITRIGSTLTSTEPVLLDIGALGKGRLVDLIATILREADVENFIIDASGDVLAAGSCHPRVGLEDPRAPGHLIGALPLRSHALCASAINRRTWGEGLHHILDARTSQPATGVLATWVSASSTMLADALATALFFTDPDHLRDHFVFEFARLHSDHHADASPAFRTAITAPRGP